MAIHNELPYAAKIEKIAEHQGVQKYIVHYIGWSSRQDVKVEVGKEAGILFKGTIKEYVKENRATIKNKQFLEDHDRKIEEEEAKEVKKVKPMEPTKNCQWIVVNGIREEFHWSLEYPDILEQLLNYDKERMKKGFVSKMPARKTVDGILEAFEASADSSKFSYAASQEIVRKFNIHFRKLLLGPNERAQYKEFSTTLTPSAHYGYIHLIRLVRRLPEFIRTTVYNLDHFNEVKSKCQDFVDFLAKHHGEFYKGREEYQKAK